MPKQKTTLTVWAEGIQNPVEQQTPGGQTQPDQNLWVVNNTGCLWDGDDSWQAMARGGTVEPGGRLTFGRCLIADWSAHLWHIRVGGPRNSQFRAYLEVPELGFSVSADGRLEGKYKYAEIAVLGPDYDHDSPVLSLIPNSNGGVGKLITLSFVVENLSDRPLRHWGMALDTRLNTNHMQELWVPTGYPIWETGLTQAGDPRWHWSSSDMVGE